MRARLILLTVSLMLGALAQIVRAQNATHTASTAKTIQGDYAVPDAPALKMLDVNESSLLRPSTVKALSAALSSASGDASFIPKAFAVEFAPGLLIDGEHLSISEYNRSAWTKLWYRTRLSFAAKRGEGKTPRSNVAGAIRLGLQDNSDLRTDSAFAVAILTIARWQADSALAAETIKMSLGISVLATATTDQQKQIDRLVGKEFSARAAPVIAAQKRAQEAARWNSDAFDVAVGTRMSSDDSTGNNTRFDGASLWLTKGWGLTANTQMLIGVRGAHERELTDTAQTPALRTIGDATVRVYFGSNAYKVLAEGQVTRGSSSSSWLTNVGGELHLSDTIWINASAGWKATNLTDKGKFVSSFKFKFNPPGA